MKNKVVRLLSKKEKTVPILSFPSASMLGVSVKELISSSDMQLQGMKLISECFNTGAAVGMMDLSCEAEAFGARVRFYDEDVPAVEEGIIDDIADVCGIRVPEAGEGRTGIFIEAVRRAKEEITDKPVFAGVIGPYSLAGRLFDMTELMMECYDSPEEVKTLLSKASEFLKKYIKAFKSAGADGVIMAEPAAGLLSPSLAEEFSMPFVNEIFNEVNSDDFVICYHNCGNAAGDMLDMIARLDADIIHLGNAIDLKKALEALPSEKLIMGNVDPLLLRRGVPDEVKGDVERVFNECSCYDNFMISTGCDVPAASPRENINAYFEKVKELYA